jgi:hypothetical protein
MDQTLYIVWNEDGCVTADTDRETAFDRMREENGGEILRCIEMELVLPEHHGDIPATAKISDDPNATATVTIK